MTSAVYAVSGRLGHTDGFDESTTSTQEEDADGNPTATNYIVDLSQLLSEQLGKQMSMMATYRLLGFHVSLRNVDSTFNDNNYGLAIGGAVAWYSPTKHRIDALQHARAYKRELTGVLRGDASDPFGPWSNDRKYTGFRYNWSVDSDDVEGALNDSTSLMPEDEFSLADILYYYNQAIGGSPGESGYDSAGGVGDALWNTRVGHNEVESLYWNASYRNQEFIDNATFNSTAFTPEFQAWEHRAPSGTHYPVLGGLLKVSVNHTNTDNPRAADVNDEYYLQFTALVGGWSDF